MIFNTLGSTSAAIIVGLTLVTPAHATRLDLAVAGGNFSAWSTLGECQAERPGEGCGVFYPDACGWSVYTFEANGKELMRNAKAGKTIEVTTMKNGMFDKHVCTLRPN